MPRAKTPEIPQNLPWPSVTPQPAPAPEQTPDLVRQAQAALSRPVALGVSRAAKVAAAIALVFLLLVLGLAFYKYHLDRPHILDCSVPETIEEGRPLRGWVQFSDRNGDVDYLQMEPLRGRFSGFAWTGPRWSSETTGLLVFQVQLEEADQGQAAFRLILVDRKGHATHVDICYTIP